MNPLISIIVPTYNVEKYIRTCIESILAQTYRNIEVIIVNDGSTDQSLEVISDLICSHHNIKVINQKNQGLSVARNTGIDAATGKYIAFVDADDKIKPDFVSSLYQIADKTGADIVRGSFRDFNGNIPKGWVPDFNVPTNCGTIVLDQFLSSNISFVVWSSIYRLDFINSNHIRFTPGILLEDGDFTARAYMLAKLVATSPEPNYAYRIRPGSILTTNNAQKMSLSEEKIISQFISMLKHEESDVLCSLILKSIYAFMKDWTRIIVKNNLSLDRTNSCFDTALTLIKEIINSKPLKEKIKFLTKVIIIKAKNH
ncbi:glycosyltransferase [Lactobacillus delbrueckii subsp. bulgaricus]|nr:glycosyltransferase [Lactobacillus delbrueckii subsp. bulgaricus]MBT9061508.1 glycosyltransferase [Lactobacillus delbrueckii subsp. bulgaricus]MBT9063119.1 glycosyltransferase [Lactobacillus delbrueckii subsp. bulgaricus]MBT9067905.1 glycosyltransferase [Lactobacillus delbrueckii subsp. bulgaricus]MBT9069920.1 glycosyltransferase [Lactobacillus delbrueckii subsp. bulgaricus]